MKFTKDFKKILRNFSSINSNMFFSKGNIQTTIGRKTSIFARVQTDVEIEESFGILDLNKFHAILNLFDDPLIKVESNKLLLTEGNKIVDYALTNPDYLLYEKNPIRFKVGDGIKTEFSLESIKYLLQMYGILKSEHILFSGTDGLFHVSVKNSDIASSDEGAITLGNTDEVFKAVILASNFKIEPDDYKITVSRKGYVHFGNDKLEYFFPVERNLSEL